MGPCSPIGRTRVTTACRARDSRRRSNALLQRLDESGGIRDVAFVERRGIELRHGRLRVLDEGHDGVDILLRHLALQRRTDAALARRAVTAAAILREERLAVLDRRRSAAA